MRPLTTVLAVAMMVIGLTLVARTIVAGGGPLAIGVVLGLLFCAAGAGRLWAERRR
jgi:hypothetical protein